MELNIHNIKGEVTDRMVTLNDSIFGIEPNKHVVWLDVKHYRMQIKSLFLIFIVLLTNCKSDKIQEINQNGYSLSYPSKLVLENNLEGVEFILFTERKSSDDEFLENINLMIQNLESMNIDLDQFVDISIDQVEQEGELISSERVKRIIPNTKESFILQKCINSI